LPEQALRIERIGTVAARFLAMHRTARVAAAFGRCVYLEADGEFLCLGAGIGNGPLNAVVETPSPLWGGVRGGRPKTECHRGASPHLRYHAAGEPASAEPAPFVTGKVFEVSPTSIRSAGVTIDISAARLWRPAPWPDPASAAAVQRGMTTIRSIAASALPTDGLSPQLFCLSSAVLGPRTGDSALERIARPRVQRLLAWLDSETAAVAPPYGARRKPPVDLLGLGPGLTPSGDDVLCGVLLALQAIGERSSAAALASAIAAKAPRLTTPLSASFLAAAAEGLSNQALHDFVAAIIAGRDEALPPVMAELGRIGHTSGWDAMAGAFAVINAAARAHRQPRSP